MRLTLAIGALLSTGAACSAGGIQYPLVVPGGCIELAQREGYPTVLENRWQVVKARAKLARLKNSDPLVHQCKEAVAQAIAEHKAARE